MRKLLCALLSCALAFGGFVAVLAQGMADWVIFVYLCGTDLESEDAAASADLKEMMEAGTGPNVRFVVQAGGTQQWAMPETIPSDRISRFEIYNHDMYGLYQGDLQNMGEAGTLREFVSWGFENYRAQRYGLVFWNHGGGSISGVCFDELFDNDSLSLEEIGEALAGYGKAFEMIGFDACLMATLETAQAVAPFAKYLVASEELEPGSGWDYTPMGRFLAENPDADGAELGKVIADGFLASSILAEDEAIITMSVTSLDKLPALAGAMNEVGWQMLAAVPDKARLNAIVKGIHRAENYGGNTPEEGYTNMVDIGSMMREIIVALPEAGKVLEALDSAVVYRVAGSGRRESTGLSTYYPLQVQGSQEYEIFKKASPSEGYRRFVAGMLYGALYGDAETFAAEERENREDEGWLSGVVSGLGEGAQQQGFVTDENSRVGLLNAYLDHEGTYTLELDPKSLDYLLSATFTLLMDDGEGVLYSLGEDDDLSVNEEDGVIQDNFGGLWTALPDGQLISLYLLERRETYSIYSAPVKLNGRETNLRILYDWGEEAFRIIGAWEGITEIGASSKEITKLAPGDAIIPLYEAYDAETGGCLGLDEGIIYFAEEGFGIEYMQLPAMDYYYSFTLTDLFGLQTNTDFVLFTVDEAGEVWFYQE
ncbi:MAG: clostripain-related cysteine peptidase [Eubacteriales bacterium]|nr:clostripain-related cysteine peptidase [Eubacteriales bacterium]